MLGCWDKTECWYGKDNAGMLGLKDKCLRERG